MKNLDFKETLYTPEISLNAKNRILKITGKSYPENSFEYYQPILQWIAEYFKDISDKVTMFYVDLEYLNSSSLKALFDIFDIFENAVKKDAKVKIQWIYDEDNDISQETGTDFKDDFKDLDIELIVKP